METFSQRLQRFQNNSPVEFIETILNSIHNCRIPKLEIASKNQLSELLILGIHTSIETISENIFLQKGIDGFKFYLENFVDAEKDGFRFSEIAVELNDWRNIIAHQYISKLGHSFGYDYSISTGYNAENSIIILNPQIFFEQFKSAFENKSKTKRHIWDYKQSLTDDQITEAKEKFIAKFNATETRKMHKSAIQAQSAFFHKDYHLSAVVLFYSLSPRVPASTN